MVAHSGVSYIHITIAVT